MGLWNAVRAWFKTEATDLSQAKDELESRIDADLSRRERELNETPEQALERIRAEAEANDSSFGDISDKIDQAVARAAAAAEANPPDPASMAPDIDPEFLDRDPGTA